jgi:hypothetical protein
MAMLSKRTALEILNGLVFAVTLVGANLANIFKTGFCLLLQIPATLILAVAYAWVASKKGRDRSYYLKEGTRRFTDFFRKWYSQEGTLSIFCKDLCWLEGAESAGIVHALSSKGDRLRLYLRNPRGRVHDQLKAVGAVVHKVKPSIKTWHRLSLLECEGYKKILVRNKEFEKKEVSFIERDSISDPYLIGLAEDLLDDCYVRGR